LLSSLATWVQDVIEQLGYLGVALLVVLENVFPPIPSEIVLPFAGFVAQQGSDSVVLMILAATVGSVIGALIMYWISAIIGDERLHAFTRRFGKWVQIREADLTRAEEWFDRHAMSAVLVGRCVPLIRSVVSIPAGFRRMKLIPYIAYTFLGSLVWNIALVGAVCSARRELGTSGTRCCHISVDCHCGDSCWDSTTRVRGCPASSNSVVVLNS
jgi:membrane protein DedA with SNARE-associated domain